MIKLKIGFIAIHPGSTNALTKLLNQFEELGHLIYRYPLSEYARTNWHDETVYSLDPVSFFSEVEEDLDFIFYSPAGPDLENRIPTFCSLNNITSIAVLDIFWMTDTELKKRFINQPDVVIVPELTTQAQLAKIGITSDIEVLGNPWFDVEKYNKDIKDIKKIAYISLPFGDEESCPTNGRVLNIFKQLVSKEDELPHLEEIVVCCHPREKCDDYNKFLSEYTGSLNITINSGMTTTEKISGMDAVIGTTSTVLLEEFLKGHNVIFHVTVEETVKSLNCLTTLVDNNLAINLPDNSTTNIVEFILNYNKKKTGELLC